MPTMRELFGFAPAGTPPRGAIWTGNVVRFSDPQVVKWPGVYAVDDNDQPLALVEECDDGWKVVS